MKIPSFTAKKNSHSDEDPILPRNESDLKKTTSNDGGEVNPKKLLSNSKVKMLSSPKKKRKDTNICEDLMTTLCIIFCPLAVFYCGYYLGRNATYHAVVRPMAKMNSELWSQNHQLRASQAQVQKILAAKDLYDDLHERGILSCTWNFHHEKVDESKEIIEKVEKTKDIFVIDEGQGDAVVLEEDEEIDLTDTEEYEGQGDGSSSTFDDDDEKEAFEVHYEEEEIVM